MSKKRQKLPHSYLKLFPRLVGHHFLQYYNVTIMSEVTADFCGQSYKHFTIVNYDSRVVTDLKLPHITVYWKDENKEKEAGYGPFLKKTVCVMGLPNKIIIKIANCDAGSWLPWNFSRTSMRFRRDWTPTILVTWTGTSGSMSFPEQPTRLHDSARNRKSMELPVNNF